MSLSILSPLPDPAKKLRDLEQENYRLREQLSDKEDELRRERVKTATIERGVSRLREALTPVYSGLQMVFGEIEATGVGSTTASSSDGMDPRVKAAWDNWKDKLGGLPARFIDALMVHGPMTQTQLRIAVGCAAGSVAGVVCTLNKAQLINKSGGRISLKEL
jgi:chromosome segregation ATPase